MRAAMVANRTEFSSTEIQIGAEAGILSFLGKAEYHSSTRIGHVKSISIQQSMRFDCQLLPTGQCAH